MDIKVDVPKDLSKIKTKVAFNLTIRQMICFVTSGAISLPLYYAVRHEIGENLATVLVVLICFPLFTLALYERDGFPAEKLFFFRIRHRFIVPGIRPYKSENMFEENRKRQRLECEVKRLENKAQKERSRKGFSLFKIYDRGVQKIEKIEKALGRLGSKGK